jgi:hypothetical protein
MTEEKKKETPLDRQFFAIRGDHLEALKLSLGNMLTYNQAREIIGSLEGLARITGVVADQDSSAAGGGGGSQPKPKPPKESAASRKARRAAAAKATKAAKAAAKKAKAKVNGAARA